MATTEDLPKAWRPPMGWNSWDSYGTTVTESEVLANARFMAEHLKDAGWDTIVVDIDWYDPTARAHGYNANAPLILDEYGVNCPTLNDSPALQTARFRTACRTDPRHGTQIWRTYDARHSALGGRQQSAGQRHSIHGARGGGP